MRRDHREALFLVAVSVAALLVLGFFVGLARACADGGLDRVAVPTAKVKRVVWSPQRRVKP